jgi:hypothetical protein
MVQAYIVKDGDEGLIVGAGEVRSALAGCGDAAACADVAMGDPVSPDIARLQHQRVWRCAGFDGRALGS